MFFFCLEIKKHISSNWKILDFLICYTVLNLDKLKLKEPEKSYELKNSIWKFKYVIKDKNITDITNLLYK